MAESPSTPPAGQAAPAEGDQKQAGIDLQKLVEKVYQLMQADLRLERARRGLANERQR